MAPKPKVTRDEIIAAAFDITREKGIDAVVAREVGKRCNVSVAPIFTVFENMDDLKLAVKQKCIEYFKEYMRDVTDYNPAFKEFGMRFVQFGINESNIYRYLFFQPSDTNNPLEHFRNDFDELFVKLIDELQSTFEVNAQEGAAIFNQMLIHSYGLTMMNLAGLKNLTADMISRSLSEVCIGLVINTQLRNNSFILPRAKMMADSTNPGIATVKKKGN